MNGYLRQLFGLHGRVALVTGGGSGLGRQIALALARAGASVVVVGRRIEKLEEAKKAVIDAISGDGESAPSPKGGSVAALKADVSSVEGIDRIVEAAPQFFGAPDILVNAAGNNNRIATEDMSPEDWRQTIDLNLRAPFLLARGIAGIPGGMKEKNQGSIINIGSLQSLRAGLGDAAYGASKGGLAQLTRFLGKEWGARNIRVNALIPGFFPTALTQSVWENDELRSKLADTTLLQRNGELADIEGAAVFLASDASAFITGCCLPVDGGFLAR